MSDNDRDSELGQESEYWRTLRGRAGSGRPAEQPTRENSWAGQQSTDWYSGQQGRQHQSGGQQQRGQAGRYDESEWPQRSWEGADIWQRQAPTQAPPAPPAQAPRAPAPPAQAPPAQAPPPAPHRPAAPPAPYEPRPYGGPSYDQQTQGYGTGYDAAGYRAPTYDQRYETEPDPATEWSTQNWTETPFESYAPPLPEVGYPGADPIGDDPSVPLAGDADPSRGYDPDRGPADWDRGPRNPDANGLPTEQQRFAEPHLDEHATVGPVGPPRRGRRDPEEQREPTGWRAAVGWLRLGPADLEVLGLWMVTRVSLFMLSVTAPYLFSGESGPVGWLDRWRQWDVLHFERIALEGYFGHDEPEEAFFPALPMLMKAGNLVGISPALFGLVVSLVAGGIAAVAISRLASQEWGEQAGRRAALVWMIAPPAVFLAAPYTEALFLGLAIPAWLAASRGHWRTAGILVAFACSVRISGLFLLVALAVLFVTSQFDRRRRKPWVDGLWLLLGSIPMAGYMAYLWANTGDALRWYHAQAEGWNRQFTWPHEALLGTVRAATGGVQWDLPANQSANFEWMFRAELVAMLVGVLVTVLLLILKRWAEGVWVGLQVAAFSFSIWFFSVPRATLLWFPLWIGIGVLSVKYKWVWWTYLMLSIPLFGVWAAAYLTGKWAG